MMKTFSGYSIEMGMPVYRKQLFRILTTLNIEMLNSKLPSQTVNEDLEVAIDKHEMNTRNRGINGYQATRNSGMNEHQGVKCFYGHCKRITKIFLYK